MNFEPLNSPYLKTYASSQAQALLPTLVKALHKAGRVYHSCLCIPAYAEDHLGADSWRQSTLHQSGSPTLVIVFGNFPENADHKAQLATQRSLVSLGFNLEQSCDMGDKSAKIQAQIVHDTASNTTQVLLLGTQGLPPQEGVGLARRILLDIAVGFWRHGIVQNPWIGTTDADAFLPCNYFEKLKESAPAGLKVFEFKHKLITSEALDPQLQPLKQAHELYEHYLYQYQQALQQAMPEFGFQTLGSIYGIHALAYEQVRGYPRRAAGEDFYLMNNIAKTGVITQVRGCEIILRIRKSKRTPFGTGPSVEKMLSASAVSDYKLFYCPEKLALWVKTLQSLQGPQENWSSLIPQSLRTKLAQQYLQSNTQEQRRKALICVMDGLRCQQLLRQIHLETPKLSWKELASNSA